MPLRISRYLARKRWTILSVVILVPIGLYTKIYSGPAAQWVNNSLGGVLYVVFWSLVFCILLPGIKTRKIAAAVFLVTCLLEIMQLWHPPFLETIRLTFIGATLIGNSFSWLDLVHYMIGLSLSLLLLKYLGRLEEDKAERGSVKHKIS